MGIAMYFIKSVWFSSKLLQLLILGPLSILFFVLFKKLYNAVRFILHYRSFPSKKSSLFFGDLKELIPSFPSLSSKASSTHTAEFILDQQAKNENEGVFVLWVSWYPVVSACDYRAAEAILTKPNHDKGSFYKFLGLKDGLVVSHGPKWKARRRMIEPFFSTKSLSSYLPSMKQSFRSLIKELEEEKMESIDMGENIHKCSLDIILKSTMSIPIESSRERKNRMIRDLEFCEKTVTIRMLNPLLWPEKMFYNSESGKIFKDCENRIDHFTESKIKEKLESRTELPKVNESERDMRNDFIDLLLNHYNPASKDATKSIDIEGMKEEILNLIIAGHDTIASGLRWTLFLLSCNLDCQEKLYNEISSSLDENDDLTDLEAISNLTYLDQCIKESMRLYPPVPILARILDHDAQVGKYRILKGTVTVFSYYNIHRDIKVWENPDSFDPDRFSEKRFAKIPKFAFIPFGHGQRSCIGQRFAMIEMKLFIIHLIRKYKLISTQTVDQVKFDMDVTMKPKTPLTLKLFPRETLA